ncbi:chlorogenic acid esterase precursor [Aspergillus fijiensis CBS 313.89]|uniref:Carboxylic ester hydrolase n=1 Tax=Aspergillus fijiensis CBS 313.89 TaxID=1448319 RepID=A0A8G1W0Z1_9EURO|nr:chlorogenic acid esterase precursor [Aspergillus fijiensis CBS 313.89]RAK78856.1 chlorogenic acid esterase precursor [Aspergillus fijiensis CBS 313.89]
MRSLIPLSLLVPAATALSLKVNTTIGQVYGMINGSTPGVAQFLGVPFAEPPLGDLRFAPPQPKAHANRTIDATKISPNCPQYPLTTVTDPSVYTIDSPWLQPYGPWSEDCLTLNIWAPLHPRTPGPLPVLIWLFGGGFYEGGLLTNGFNPSPWIQRTQEHIVVAVNYRNNIFGFPNAAGLASTNQNTNQGLLDQRLAVEWVRDNIASFGGDRSRMVLWGQSSGAASVDYFNFAWPADPIVHGLIMHSGSVFATGASKDVTHSNFTFVAEQLGCGGGLAASEELACMRHNVSAEALVAFYENYTLGADAPALKFTTIVDGVTKFGNFTERALEGNYSGLPAILGTNANEEASLVAWVGPQGPNQTYIHHQTLETDQCPANYYNELRYNTSSLTFRWYNLAHFPNTSPRPWEKAYHASELPLLFGTYQWYGGAPTALQRAVSTRWQDLYLAFMKDPVHALPSMGWPAYTPDGQAMAFGANGTVSSLMPVSALAVGCAEFPLPTQ